MGKLEKVVPLDAEKQSGLTFALGELKSEGKKGLRHEKNKTQPYRLDRSTNEKGKKAVVGFIDVNLSLFLTFTPGIEGGNCEIHFKQRVRGAGGRYKSSGLGRY